MLDFSKAFTIAARALTTGIVDTGITGTGVRKLDFTANGKTFTAIEQNPDKLSPGGQLAREGHQVVQIRDNEAQKLIGNVVDQTQFNRYDTGQKPVDVMDLERALDSAA